MSALLRELNSSDVAFFMFDPVFAAEHTAYETARTAWLRTEDTRWGRHFRSLMAQHKSRRDARALQVEIEIGADAATYSLSREKYTDAMFAADYPEYTGRPMPKPVPEFIRDEYERAWDETYRILGLTAAA